MTLHLVVAVPTFRRPQLLAAALDGVNAQLAEVINAERVPLSAHVVVVDNDPEGTARTVADAAGARYVLEHEAGLSAARNRALDAAAEADLLIFLDDDEVPDAGWLWALLSLQAQTGADAVAGRVSTVLPDDTDAWTRAAYQRPRRTHGERMAAAATNNLLLDLRTVRRLGLRFDQRLGLVGGEDTMFTTQLVRGGGVLRWCEDSHVLETIDETRLQRRWILMRSYRSGNTHALVHVLLARASMPARMRLIAGGLGRLGIAVAALVVSGGNPIRRAAAERRICRSVGLVTGALGFGYQEYGRRRRGTEGEGGS